MADHSRSSRAWLLSLKIILVTSAALSVAAAVKVSVPVVVKLTLREVPLFWELALTWLRPPYLYLIFNCIILALVASSKLQSRREEPKSYAMEAAEDPAAGVRTDYLVYDGFASKQAKSRQFEAARQEIEQERVEKAIRDAEEVKMMANDASPHTNDDDRELDICRTPAKKDPSVRSLSKEKPLVSSRFGHRKSVKASPEGARALGVSRPKRQDTLESTWKMITEGRPMPLTRHQKKTDAWEPQARRGSKAHPPPEQATKGSEASGDCSGGATGCSLTRSSGSGRFRREPSPSQDELNRRVEAFITKFNEEMRLQRLKSLDQYQEMVSRRGC